MICKYFLPFWVLPFHYVDNVTRYTNVFNFGEVQFFHFSFVVSVSLSYLRNIGLWFYFLVVSLSGFGIRVMLASKNELGSVPSSLIFWKSLIKISVNSSLNV